MDINELALELHKKYKGKITTKLRDSQIDRQKLSAYYSPGVAAVSQAIAGDPQKIKEYTWTNNLVAVISDGSSVLGLGNIGGKASMPVMEGKALLFKHFANIDSIPIILEVQEAEEIIRTIKNIAPSFGAINLEDFAAPKCFEIEERLKDELDIPVFHDDQHGTAVIVLAGLINAMKLTGRSLSDAKIVVSGVGAAGIAIIKLLNDYAKPEIYAVDSKGVISKNRTDLNNEKRKLLECTNPASIEGSLEDVLKGADIFIGVSKAGLLTPEMVASMNHDATPIIFALANPIPEIMPAEAEKVREVIMATGRSDLPNQVNNAIAFPGIFRGALDNKVQKITKKHKIAAAEAIANLVKKPSVHEIVPSIMDDDLVSEIAKVII